MAKKIGSRTITVVRRTKVDRLSTTLEALAPTILVTGCVVMPRTSFEQEKGWVVVEGRMIVAPHGSDVLASDQVQVDGHIWDVDGEPGEYEDRRGRVKAMVFYLKRVGS